MRWGKVGLNGVDFSFNAPLPRPMIVRDLMCHGERDEIRRC